jgi:signal recognition particle subunit SRP54
MTIQERNDPTILNGSRRKRIARGSATTVQEVNQLINKFNEMKKMFRALSGAEESGKRHKRMPNFPFMK